MGCPNKKLLQAKFELRENNAIAIVVQDSTAQYPITIDPLNKVPDWTGTAEGILPSVVGQLAIDAAYGFSVAGVGDVNGDGFADGPNDDWLARMGCHARD